MCFQESQRCTQKNYNQSLIACYLPRKRRIGCKHPLQTSLCCPLRCISTPKLTCTAETGDKPWLMRHLKRNEACLISGSSYVAEYSILSPFFFLFAPPWLSQITLQEIAEDVISREMEWQAQSKGKAIMWEQKMHHDKKSNTQVLWSIFLCVSHVHVMLGKDSYIYKKKKWMQNFFTLPTCKHPRISCSCAACVPV